MTVLGANALMRKIADIPRRERKAIKDALLVSGNEMSNFWVVRIQKNSGTGRKYKRGKRTHTASSPGEYDMRKAPLTARKSELAKLLKSSDILFS